jgi:transposase-like protein
MGKMAPRRHTREFKTSIIRELESGMNLAQLSRENNFHPTMISRWKLEYRKDPELAFNGNGNIYKESAKNQEFEKRVQEEKEKSKME